MSLSKKSKLSFVFGATRAAAIGCLAGALVVTALLLLVRRPPAVLPAGGVVRAASVAKPPCVQPAEYLKEFRFKPNCSGAGFAGSTVNEIVFNSDGFRDLEREAHAKPATYRIMVLGSSNVLGIGVPQNATITRLLEADLARMHRRKFEVINVATIGYCAWQSTFRLRELLDRFHPDLVLYNIGFPNCFMGDAAWASRVLFDKAGDPIGLDRSLTGLGRGPAWINNLYFRPDLFFPLHAGHDAIRRILLSRQLRELGSDGAAKLLLSPTNQALQFMNRASNEAGAFFISFYHPSPEPVLNQVVPIVFRTDLTAAFARFQPDLMVPPQEMISALHASGVPVLRLRGFDYKSLPDDYHLSEEGTRDWSRSLALNLTRAFGLKKGKWSELRFNSN